MNGLARGIPSFLIGAVLCAVGCDSGSTRTPPAGGTMSKKTPPKTQALTSDSSNSRMRFTTRPKAIDFTYLNDETAGHFAIVESLGGGLGIIDFDNDGRPDVFVSGGGHYESNRLIGDPSGLFRNQGDFVFQACKAAAGVATQKWYSHAAMVFDFDNDGFQDVLVTGYGGLTFWSNQGDGTFLDQTGQSGLTDKRWSSSAAFGDFNGDGNLDLYIAHYTDWSMDNNPVCTVPQGRDVCPPREFQPLPDVLYLSLGDGTFVDGTSLAGLRADGKGLGVVAADFDHDGDVDLYVANDTVENFLYRNNGDGVFEDHSLISGTSLSAGGTPEGSMGVNVCDYNNDGLPDIWVANYESENFGLYQNLGKGSFRHVSQETGVSAIGGVFVGWGALFADFDNDGDEDSVVSNGHVIRHPVNAPLKQQPLLLMNDDAKRLLNVTNSGGDYFRDSHMGRGIAAGDLNQDGHIDLVVSHTNEPVEVLENTTIGEHHAFLRLRLVGTGTSRIPVGARVTLATSKGRQYRQVTGGGSYASTSEQVMHFGLGSDAQSVTAEITWPGGAKQKLNDLELGSSYTVIESGAIHVQH